MFLAKITRKDKKIILKKTSRIITIYIALAWQIIKQYVYSYHGNAIRTDTAKIVSVYPPFFIAVTQCNH